MSEAMRAHVPAFQAIANVPRQFAGRRDLLQACFQPRQQRIDDGPGQLPTDGLAGAGILVPDRLLDRVQFGDGVSYPNSTKRLSQCVQQYAVIHGRSVCFGSVSTS